MGCANTSNPQASEVASTLVFCPSDYKELESYSGSGIKRTKAWTSQISSIDLENRRKNFWNTRTAGYRQVWMCIRQAAEADADTAVTLLEMAGISTENNSMLVCFDIMRNRYELHPFLLTDPVHSVSKQKKKVKTPKKQEKIKIKLRNVEDTELCVSNLDFVKALKKNYCDEKKLENVRLFFGGKELEDDRQLWSYSIKNDMVIQVYVKA